jgi:hypothetical protein
MSAMSRVRLPFRFRYWVVRQLHIYDINVTGKYKVVRQRTSLTVAGSELVDGPFDYQDDAVRALAFWHAQDERKTTRRMTR